MILIFNIKLIFLIDFFNFLFKYKYKYHKFLYTFLQGNLLNPKFIFFILIFFFFILNSLYVHKA